MLLLGLRSLWCSLFVVWAVLDANHTGGGVLFVWDRRDFEKVDVVVGRFSVSVIEGCSGWF